MNTSTRCATQQDVSALVRLWQQFMRDENNAVPDADPAAALRNWTERLRSQIENSHVVTVESSGNLVGFAGFIDASDRDWIPESIAYVVDIYVVPEARASRAAKLLFEHLLSNAAQRYAEVWTNTSVQNRRVQVLLKRAGFTPLAGFEIPELKDQLYFKRKGKTPCR
jgi:ribosomal protein S18 acetylase RimI-like enzyme